MRIITNPSKEIIAYAAQDRDADHQKPSEKQTTADGKPLYWLPLHAIDRENPAREIELIAFTTKPLPVRALDLIALDGATLMNVYGGRGSDPIAMYSFNHAQVVGNMLDALDGFAQTSQKEE